MDREPRTALLFLGDSRTRWLLLWQAQQICDPMLRCFRYLGAPRCSFSVRDVPLVLALDGMANWRSGGGFVCSNASALSFVGYYVHYGLSSQPPYQRNAGTWHARMTSTTRAMIPLRKCFARSIASGVRLGCSR